MILNFKIIKKGLLFTLITLPISTTFAQNETEEVIEQIKINTETNKNEWRFKLEPNMVLPKITGTVGAGQVKVPIYGDYDPQFHVVQSPKEFLKRLKIGSMIAIEGYNDNWAINGDFSYFVLEEDVKLHTFIDDIRLNAKVKETQFFGDITVFRRVTPWLELGIGANIVNVGTTIDAIVDYNEFFDPNKPKQYDFYVSKSENWVDPMIAARIQNKPDAKILYMARGDIGGFNIGSKLAWQTIGHIGYRFNKTVYGIVGYRYISLDYLKGKGMERFKYDMHIAGPMVKIGFNIP